MSFPNWHQRPDKFDPETNVTGRLDGESFIRVADQFISLANQRNRKIDATELQLVMLFAAARYAAPVGETEMKIFLISSVIAIMIAVAAFYVLQTTGMDTASVTSGPDVRL